jgi:4-hydroxy-tetrahydrodipicolinate synthase
MKGSPMFQGCGTALVTPFKSDLSLDEEALRRLVQRQIEGGIHFLVPCGTTGENPTLTRKEHLRRGRQRHPRGGRAGQGG